MRHGARHGIDRREWSVRAREFCARGTELPHAKMNADIVRTILVNREGRTAKEWAAALGVHVRTIEKIRTRETWSHVQ